MKYINSMQDNIKISNMYKEIMNKQTSNKYSKSVSSIYTEKKENLLLLHPRTAWLTNLNHTIKWKKRNDWRCKFRCVGIAELNVFLMCMILNKLSIGIFMYKHHTNQLPSNYSTYFTEHIQTHNYLTRNAQDYIINKTFFFCGSCH